MARDDSSDPVLAVDAQGEVREVTPAARRRLASVAGRWRLLSSSGHLMIWQRDDAPLGDMPAHTGASMAGEITAPGMLADVINFMHFNQWDGSLAVLTAGTRRTLFFQKGQLLTAQSNVPEDRLGALLVRFGHITAEQLNACIREVTPAKRLGALLVDKGLMKAPDLFTGVRRQVEEIFFNILMTRRGAFTLGRQLDDALMTARFRLDTQALLLEGLRRIDEMDYFREKLAGPDVVLARRGGEPPTLEGDTLAVYRWVDSRRTLGEITRESRLGEFAATKAAFELLQRGFVVVRQPSVLLARQTLQFSTDVSEELLGAYNDALARVQEILGEHGQEAALRDATAAFLAGSERYADLLDAVVPGKDGRLPPALLLANLERIDEARRSSALKAALHELVRFVLFICHDWLSKDDEEEIQERLAREIERLRTQTSA